MEEENKPIVKGEVSTGQPVPEEKKAEEVETTETEPENAPETPQGEKEGTEEKE